MAAKERRHGERRKWGPWRRRRGQRQETEAQGTQQHSPPARLWPLWQEALSAGTAPAKEAGQLTTSGNCQHRPPLRLSPRRRSLSES